MNTTVTGQEWIADAEASDLGLLAAALQGAVDARRAGRLIGPVVDEVALRRAARRALRADLARGLRIVPVGDVA